MRLHQQGCFSGDRSRSAGIAKVNAAYQITDLEIFYDPHDLMAKLCSARSLALPALNATNRCAGCMHARDQDILSSLQTCSIPAAAVVQCSILWHALTTSQFSACRHDSQPFDLWAID